MKSISSVLFFSVFLFAFTCQQEMINNSNDTCVNVSVLRSICGTAVLQIKDPTFYHLGENVGSEQNVFLANVESKESSANVKRDEIDLSDTYVLINPDDFNSDGIQCLAMVNYAGTKQHNVRFVEPCEQKED